MLFNYPFIFSESVLMIQFDLSSRQVWQWMPDKKWRAFFGTLAFFTGTLFSSDSSLWRFWGVILMGILTLKIHRWDLLNIYNFCIQQICIQQIWHTYNGSVSHLYIQHSYLTLLCQFFHSLISFTFHFPF